MVHHDYCYVLSVTIVTYNLNDTVDVMDRIRNGLTTSDSPQINIEVIPAA